MREHGIAGDEGDLPRLALKPVVFNPSTPASFSPAKEENAAKDGFNTPPYESQNVPNVQNTTAGKLLPRIHSRRPPRVMRIPPWKKYTGLTDF